MNNKIDEIVLVFCAVDGSLVNMSLSKIGADRYMSGRLTLENSEQMHGIIGKRDRIYRAVDSNFHLEGCAFIAIPSPLNDKVIFSFPEIEYLTANSDSWETQKSYGPSFLKEIIAINDNNKPINVKSYNATLDCHIVTENMNVVESSYPCKGLNSQFRDLTKQYLDIMGVDIISHISSSEGKISFSFSSEDPLSFSTSICLLRMACSLAATKLDLIVMFSPKVSDSNDGCFLKYGIKVSCREVGIINAAINSLIFNSGEYSGITNFYHNSVKKFYKDPRKNVSDYIYSDKIGHDTYMINVGIPDSNSNPFLTLALITYFMNKVFINSENILAYDMIKNNSMSCVHLLENSFDFEEGIIDFIKREKKKDLDMYMSVSKDEFIHVLNRN